LHEILRAGPLFFAPQFCFYPARGVLPNEHKPKAIQSKHNGFKDRKRLLRAGGIKT
jgi:hypothetical protein